MSTNMSNNNNNMISSQRRPMGGKISLASFAQRKGEVRALEAFKKRKSDKQKATSIALRKYRRVMKQEGLEAGTGASRKRKPSSSTKDDRGEDQDEDEDDDERNENGDGDDGDVEKSDMLDDVGGRGKATGEKKHTKKRPKTNPFQKSIEKAELAKKQMEQVKNDMVQNEKDRQQKLKQRREQTKLLKQRTRKGQPIMKNQVEHLLYKLEKQQKHGDRQQQQQQQRDRQHPRSNRNRR